MKRRWITGILATLACCTLTVGIAACNDNAGKEDVWTMERVYAAAQELGFEGTLEELIEQFKGADGVGISRIYLNEKNQLIIELTSGTYVNLGAVKGAQGDAGVGIKNAYVNEKGELVVVLTDGTFVNCGIVKGLDGKNGKDGTDGKDGSEIVSAYLDSDGNLILRMKDGSTINCGKLPVCFHNYSAWETGLAPTCTSIGYDERTCAKCGDTDYRFLEQTGHNPTAASYTQSLHAYVCADCGAYVQETHRFEEDVCTVCGYKLNYTVGLSYQLNKDGKSYSVKGLGTATDTDIVIPALYYNLPVTEIGIDAFFDRSLNSKIKSVVIPDSVITIGYQAFFDCYLLESVSIGSGVSSIGNYAFGFCKALTSLTVSAENPVYYSAGNCIIERDSGILRFGCNASVIPECVTAIDTRAFYGCTALTEIEIPASVVSIGSMSFESCSALARLEVAPDNPVYYSAGNCIIERESKKLVQGSNSSVIPAEVTEIGAYAFYGRGLTEIFIPVNVTEIGGYAFWDCEGLQAVTFAENSNLKTIGEYAFSYCINLQKITLPEGLTAIGRGVFRICRSLEAITLPDSLKEIGSSAFGGCWALTEIEIPQGVISIGNQAFSACKNLVRITLPEGLTSLGLATFHNCTLLANIVLPQGLLSIGTAVFMNCDSLKYIAIPEGVTTIGGSAFANCNNLKSIVIPKSVKEITRGVFSGCYSLEAIFYTGTVEEWIALQADLLYVPDVTVYFYSEGSPTEAGNYWRYDEHGEIVIWKKD